MRVSVVINTLNEADNIAACMDSVDGLADEIIVCDMHSDDGTVAIAESKGARIILHARTGFVEPARHFAISQAASEWVLVLDADERMCSPLKEKLVQTATDDQVDVVCFWSLYWFFGGWVHHGGFFNGNWARFFRKSTYLKTYSNQEVRIHENFRNIRETERVLQLSNHYYIEHYAYPTIEKYVTKTLGSYARIEAQQMLEAGQNFSLFKLLWEPIREGAGRFFIRQGFRDGVRGLILAVLYASFRFSIWANLWFLENERNVKAASKVH